jgi:hypothetical protein
MRAFDVLLISGAKTCSNQRHASNSGLRYNRCDRVDFEPFHNGCYYESDPFSCNPAFWIPREESFVELHE